MEFQTQMCCGEKLISERNQLERKLCEKHEYMASIQHDQANDFLALLCKHDTLCREFNTLQIELKSNEKEYNSLFCENNELDVKLDEYGKNIEKLKCNVSTDLETAKILKNQHCNAVKIKQRLQNDLEELELKQRAIDRKTIDVQHQLAEKITEHAELEKTINTEENESERMILLINDLRIKSEKCKKSFETMDAKLNDQLKDKLAKLDGVKQNILDKKAEVEFHGKRITELRSKIETLENNRLNDKCTFDKKVYEINTEIQIMKSKIFHSCAKHIELQKDITASKSHLNDQDVVIKLMESSRDRALEKVSKIRETTESIKNNIETLREQREKEKENSVMEMDMKIKEKSKLMSTIENQLEQLKVLAKANI
ncbi:kinectin-like [Sipha flava]|jgi:chromosome segregation ATPase|uniref:Kinectin-like n=1 Tax=Sipha flava TaxID=143950 RepID=A0A8B8FRF6_9HEMI|nr:kinectin-like [Sipha flava]